LSALDKPPPPLTVDVFNGRTLNQLNQLFISLTIVYCSVPILYTMTIRNLDLHFSEQSFCK